MFHMQRRLFLVLAIFASNMIWRSHCHSGGITYDAISFLRLSFSSTEANKSSASHGVLDRGHRPAGLRTGGRRHGHKQTIARLERAPYQVWLQLRGPIRLYGSSQKTRITRYWTFFQDEYLMMRSLARTYIGDYRRIYVNVPTTRAELNKAGAGVNRFIVGEDGNTTQLRGFITKKDAEQWVKILPNYVQLKNAPVFVWLRLGVALKLYTNPYKDNALMYIPYQTAIWITRMDQVNVSNISWSALTFWTDQPKVLVKGYMDNATSRRLVNVLGN
eukprot:gnl/TRDRNA2_/TRDRNA2_43979_c0_seq1.p1 gnl/TRDRNA2_/TRDRNA2_43979_c0~~gnl/TRDRNA2_/TRDRNA2_43979_c0_seq1.p1  ORF type:complete len:274 (+),score=9.01 gnl/TRDRNA2_/TRDRNA2_43979_c0_seq1:44-865(+)